MKDCILCAVNPTFEGTCCKVRICFECGVGIRLKYSPKELHTVPCPRCDVVPERGWHKIGKQYEHDRSLDPSDTFDRGVWVPLQPKI